MGTENKIRVGMFQDLLIDLESISQGEILRHSKWVNPKTVSIVNDIAQNILQRVATLLVKNVPNTNEEFHVETLKSVFKREVHLGDSDESLARSA